jgi:excinuclease UvrABC ATPase subunit
MNIFGGNRVIVVEHEDKVSFGGRNVVDEGNDAGRQRGPLV